MTVYQRANGNFIADVLLDSGRRIRKTFKTKAEATAYDKLLLTAQITDQAVPDGKVHTVYEVFWHAYETIWKTCKSRRTQYMRTRQWVRVLGAKTDVRLVTTALVQDLIIQFRDVDKNAPGTLNRRIGCLNTIMKHAKSRGYIDKVPEPGFFKVEQSQRRILREGEEQRLYEELARINPYHRWLAQFLLYTGMRVGEALSITWANVEGSKVHLWTTKGGTTRHIPLTRQALEALEAIKADHPEKPWEQTYMALHKAMIKVRDRMGILPEEHFGIHCLRHTCATRMVRARVNPTTIQSWLGHTDLKTTQIYMKVEASDMLEAANILERAFAAVPPVPLAVPCAAQNVQREELANLGNALTP